MRYAAIALVIVIIAIAPWIKACAVDGAFKQDVALAPELIGMDDVLTAEKVYRAVFVEAKEHDVELAQDGVFVEVSDTYRGSLKLRGGGVNLSSPRKTAVQDVTIHIHYTRPIYLGIKKNVEFTLKTAAHGGSKASSYPLEGDLEPAAGE